MARRLLLLLGIVGMGCVKRQTGQTGRAADLAKLCEAPSRSGAATHPFYDRPRRISEWLDQNITDPQVRSLFDELARVPPDQKVRMLREAAAEVGLEHCELADSLVTPPPPEQ